MSPPLSITYVKRKLPAVASAVAVAATASAAATEVIALGYRLGLVNRQAASFELRAVERVDGALRLAARRHFEKIDVCARQ